MFSAKQRLVCLCHFLNSLAYSADSGQHHLHIVSLHVQVSYLFHNLPTLVHLCKSNTEPIIRVYSEANTMEAADALGKKLMQVVYDMQ